jgi:hypothetical protein
MDDFTPPTQPSDALVPPPKGPPTAIATSAPLPPDRHRNLRRTFIEPDSIRQLIRKTLDIVDDMADAVAGGLGLRHP